MDLRQQFLWKVLIGISFSLILFFIYGSYSKYSDYTKYRKEYERELEVKENKDLQMKANFITNKQDSRIDLDIDVNNIIEKSITNHVRSGIKVNTKSGWESNEPIYKGMVGDFALIAYREFKKGRYKVNDKIKGTDMMIVNFNADSVIIKYTNGDLKAFYLPSYEQIKK